MTAREPTVHRDGDAVVVDIPMSFRRRSGRKEVVLPPGAVAPIAMPAKVLTPLAIAMARAFRWQEMIESGQAQSNSDLARRLKVDQSYVARIIRLASLAPDIVEAIMGGQEPDGLSLRTMRGEIPLGWEEQRQMLGMEEKWRAPSRELPLCVEIAASNPGMVLGRSPELDAVGFLRI